jgi:hypothetical protein
MDESVWDWIVFAWLIVNTVMLCVVLTVLLYKRKTLILLRYKQPYYLYALIVFGIVTPWFVFVSNDHLSMLDGVREYSCALWSYWLSHVFGINTWFVLMTLRILDKMFIFHAPVSSWRRSRKILVRASVFVAMTMPLVLLSANVSLANWSRYDTALNTCTSVHVEQKVFLAVWYTAMFLVLNILFRYLEKDIHNAYFVDYMTLNDTSFVAQYVFISNILTNLFGAVYQWYGRTLYTFNISVLFTFTVLRLCGKAVFRSLQNIRDDVVVIERTTATPTLIYDLQFRSLLELRISNDLLRGYFQHAIRKTIDPSRRRQLEYIIECVQAIEQIQYSYIPVYQQHAIITTYFSPGCRFHVGLLHEQHKQVMRTMDVCLARKYLFEYMERHFYGMEYLAMINGDADMVFNTERPWQKPQPMAKPQAVRDLFTSNEWQQFQMYADDDDDDDDPEHHNHQHHTHKTDQAIPLQHQQRTTNVVTDSTPLTSRQTFINDTITYNDRASARSVSPTAAPLSLPTPRLAVRSEADSDDDEREEPDPNSTDSDPETKKPTQRIRTATRSLRHKWQQSKRRRGASSIVFL